MDEFIKAITFLSKFVDKNRKFPISCEHDVLNIWGVNFDNMTANDVRTLDGLGFEIGLDDDFDESPNWASISEAEWQKIKTSGVTNCVHSYLWGSC